MEMDDKTGADVIIPRYKLIVTYDILPATQESYFRFVMEELVPSLQEMGVYMIEAWHTAYGDYPLRMATFVTEDYETIDNLLGSEKWADLEGRFKLFIKNYSYQVVPYRQGFQFVRQAG